MCVHIFCKRINVDEMRMRLFQLDRYFVPAKPPANSIYIFIDHKFTTEIYFLTIHYIQLKLVRKRL